MLLGKNGLFIVDYTNQSHDKQVKCKLLFFLICYKEIPHHRKESFYHEMKTFDTLTTLIYNRKSIHSSV